MSRSYKKNPFLSIEGNSKHYKSFANRLVRRSLKSDEDMPARIQHKKISETYHIHDYRDRMSRAEAIYWYNDDSQYKSAAFKKRFPTLEAWLKYWDKCYRRK